ncbi:hypothetical protein AVEN_200265-1 [Araneus ventricosus]|uniref:Uncharacterized protein n=1 Tax=Araneus ventricosus TaxID=182803 RepID=A0A4Y2DR79_ARAVE|nr:hypothetical protein AVEN_200265-1 [Araneus ventricosus]
MKEEDGFSAVSYRLPLHATGLSSSFLPADWLRELPPVTSINAGGTRRRDLAASKKDHLRQNVVGKTGHLAA